MGRHDRDDGLGQIAVGIMLPAVGIAIALAAVTRSIGPAAIPIWFAACGAAAWILRGPLGQALAQRIAGPPAAADDESQQAVYGELDELRARVQELEERVDFSERIIAANPREPIRTDEPTEL